MSNSAEDDLQEILFIMGGGDGCLGYLALVALVQRLSRQAEAGNSEAEAVLEVVRKFRRLIDFANDVR